MDPKACPSCGREVSASAAECLFCGVIFSKWQRREERQRREPPRPPTPDPISGPPPARAGSSGLRLLALAVSGVLLIVAVVWWQGRGTGGPGSGLPRWARSLAPATTLSLNADPVSDFDLSGKLPAGPIGMAWTGYDFVVGSRDDPWGFLRLSPAGERSFEVVTVPVIEPVYNQTVGFSAVTWNGRQVVGYTTGAWFEETDEMVFTVHDPETLRVLETHPAPPLLGCLTWDGRGYWAATRRNTADSGEPAFLYRLSPDFEVLERTEPPGVGCQGLAWDGELLWFADVFDDTLSMLDPSSSPPRLSRRYETRFNYLSGVAFDGEHIWVSEYGEDSLNRLNSRLVQAWRSGTAPEAMAGGDLPGRQRSGPREALPAGEVTELRRKLRSEDWAERLEAEMELRERNLPIDYDRSRNQTPDPPGPETLEVYDWAVELRDGALYASWHLYFGEALISEAAEGQAGPITLPLFARYTITIEGGTLSSPIEREFEAEVGDNQRSDVELTSTLGPGTYQVSLFLHVQYVKPDGEGQILNQSAATLEVGQ